MQRVISVLLRNLVYGLDVYSLHCFSFIYLFELTVALDYLVGQNNYGKLVAEMEQT